MTPAEEMLRLAGSGALELASAQVTGGLPPLEVSWEVYAVPTVPCGSVVVVMASVLRTTVMERVAETV